MSTQVNVLRPPIKFSIKTKKTCRRVACFWPILLAFLFPTLRYVTQHDDAFTSFLPNHPPKILNSELSGCLKCQGNLYPVKQVRGGASLHLALEIPTVPGLHLKLTPVMITKRLENIKNPVFNRVRSANFEDLVCRADLVATSACRVCKHLFFYPFDDIYNCTACHANLVNRF